MQDFLNGLLEEAINELERDATNNQFDSICIQQFANISRLINRDDLVPRIVAVWENAIDFTKRPDVFRNLQLDKPVDKIIQYLPTYPKDTLPVTTTTSELHISLCLQRRYYEARQFAKNELALEDIAATQIVMGDFDAAKETLQMIKTRTSARDLQIVFIVELFRRDRNDEAESLLNELRKNGLRLWEYIHLAYGLAGHEPWGGYPYFDY